jgi:O-antigen ligase
VTAAVGIWQQVVGHAYLHDLGYAYDDNIRFTSGFTLRSFSTFNLPFSFGFYEMLVILIGLPMSLAQPKRLRSKLFFLSLPLLSVGLLFSFVRGAMLGLAIGLLYLAFHRYKILVYGIPIVLVAALFIPSGANVSNAVFSSTSFGARTISWQDRIDLFARSPVFGSGIGTTGAAAEKAAKLNNKDPNSTYYPDNSWLKVAFELGVFALWFLVIMLVMMFLSTRETERRVSGIDKDFVCAVSATLLAIMASSIVATYLELVPMDQLFWTMIAIVATMAPDLAAGPAVSAPGTVSQLTPPGT